MAITPFAYSPTAGWLDTNTFPRMAPSESVARNELQMLFNQVRDYVNQLPQQIQQAEHPVDSMYFTMKNENPATTFGFGTWALVGAGKVPVCVDNNDSAINAAGKTTGSKTYTNSFTSPAVYQGDNSAFLLGGAAWRNYNDDHAGTSIARSSAAVTANTGVSAQQTSAEITTITLTGSNLPPEIACYIWKRTA